VDKVIGEGSKIYVFLFRVSCKSGQSLFSRGINSTNKKNLWGDNHTLPRPWFIISFHIVESYITLKSKRNEDLWDFG
jgi:hypothetical protein